MPSRVATKLFHYVLLVAIAFRGAFAIGEAENPGPHAVDGYRQEIECGSYVGNCFQLHSVNLNALRFKTKELIKYRGHWCLQETAATEIVPTQIS